MIHKILRFFKIKPQITKTKKVLHQKPRHLKLVLQGSHYNLKELYDQINTQYFEGKLDLRITWVGYKHSMPTTRVMFGSFNHEKHLIKIHRRLDQSHIPRYFISFVIYHEMLHHTLPPIIKWNQKRKIHHPAFTQKEKQFQDYALVKEFNKQMRKTWFKY